MKRKPMTQCFTVGNDSYGKQVHYKREKWIRTKEDWYPSFKANEKSPAWNDRAGWFRWNNPLNHKAVYVMLSLLCDGMWRVAVWGADDCGMEVDYPHDCLGTALCVFNEIKDFATKDYLASMGLHGA
jgi:hypothetical protein